MPVVNVTPRPVLPLLADDHAWLSTYFFNDVYQPPWFKSDTEQRRQERLRSFIRDVRKMPVFWAYEEDEHDPWEGRYQHRRNLVALCSDGRSMHLMRRDASEQFFIYTDSPESYAYVEEGSESLRLLAVFFNPRSPW